VVQRVIGEKRTQSGRQSVLGTMGNRMLQRVIREKSNHSARQSLFGTAVNRI